MKSERRDANVGRGRHPQRSVTETSAGPMSVVNGLVGKRGDGNTRMTTMAMLLAVAGTWGIGKRSRI